MNTAPLSLSDWKFFASDDPAGAAVHWLERVDALDSATRTAALAHVGTPGELTNAWRRAVAGGGPLNGVPFLAKDLFDAAGWPTTASSTFLTEVRPTPSTDATAIATVRRQGALLAGKSHLNEFAYGLSGENPHFGDCPHPQAPTLLSGGSSSGSAWAVGAGLVPFALGTDTGGSIRVPASYCGLFGVRLTPAHPWSRQGCFPLAPSFDSAGWFTRSASDMIELLRVLLPLAPANTSGERELRGVWIGDPTGLIDGRLLSEMTRLADKLGAEVQEGAIADFVNAIRDSALAFNVLQSTEAMGVHSAWIDRYAEHYDPAVLARIRRAERWTEQERSRAELISDRVRCAFDQAFAAFDFVVLPAVPRPAVSRHDLDPDLRETLLALNTPASLAQLPALAVPLLLDAVRSVGLQVVFREIDPAAMATVLRRVPD